MRYMIISFISGIWVIFDGSERKTPWFVWAVWTALLWPFILPVYLAKRPLLPGEIREGGTWWNVLRNLAISWTIFMALSAFIGLIEVSERVSGLEGEGLKAGAALGTALGLGAIVAVWFFPFVGAVVLGFLLRKSSVVERGSENETLSEATNRQRMGPAGWIGVVLLCLIVIGTIARKLDPQTEGKTEHDETSSTQAEEQTAHKKPALLLLSSDCRREFGVIQVVGEVKNLTTERLRNVLVVATFRTKTGRLVKSGDSFIEFNPILPGQSSPFTVSDIDDPIIEKYDVTFKFRMGETITHISR